VLVLWRPAAESEVGGTFSFTVLTSRGDTVLEPIHDPDPIPLDEAFLFKGKRPFLRGTRPSGAPRPPYSGAMPFIGQVSDRERRARSSPGITWRARRRTPSPPFGGEAAMHGV